ncbi:hypothetical protein OIU76_003149 [Salix suchowensis]|nr:hypothetical protein OIU76_003149 [Salix suchowensis]
MDGVLFSNSEEPLRTAGVDTFDEIGKLKLQWRILCFSWAPLKGFQPPAPKSRTLKRFRNQSSADTGTAEADGGSSSEGNLCLKISLPVKYHFSKVS